SSIEEPRLSSVGGSTVEKVTENNDDTQESNVEQSSYARAMIKLWADVELKDTILVVMPKLVENNLKNPRKAARSVHDGTKMAFKPLKQVYRPVSNRNNASSSENVDSDSKAEDVVDDHAFFMASIGLKRDVDSGYGTNSLLEQWMTTKWDDDYDPFDDDLYESHHISENLQVISDDLDITTRGRKKK
nr:hypothetical protein [Tanacetum cinerariifolium]